MIELENGVFMEQVEDLSRKKLWPDVRDMLLLLEPADIAAILAEVSVDRLPLLYRLLPKERRRCSWRWRPRSRSF
jgi:Mg/Co/Ni transporter MgtE